MLCVAIVAEEERRRLPEEWFTQVERQEIRVTACETLTRQATDGLREELQQLEQRQRDNDTQGNIMLIELFSFY